MAGPVGGQARASYPRKTSQKKRPKPPHQKSIISHESRPCVWWWCSVYNYFQKDKRQKKLGYRDGAISSLANPHCAPPLPTHTSTLTHTRRRHANTHTRWAARWRRQPTHTGDCSEDSGSGHPEVFFFVFLKVTIYRTPPPHTRATFVWYDGFFWRGGWVVFCFLFFWDMTRAPARPLARPNWTPPFFTRSRPSNPPGRRA